MFRLLGSMTECRAGGNEVKSISFPAALPSAIDYRLKVLREEKETLIEQSALTPFSREESGIACELDTNPSKFLSISIYDDQPLSRNSNGFQPRRGVRLGRPAPRGRDVADGRHRGTRARLSRSHRALRHGASESGYAD